jgi:hypothetical protein
MFTTENLSRAEKLRLMETLWRDLSADSDELPSPAWHGEALKQTEAAVANGSARMVDWSDAKALLRQRAQP